MEPSGNIAMWSGIISFGLPVLIAAINRHAWSSTMKGLVAFVVCMIAAAGTAYFAGDINNEGDVATAALVVFGGAIATYNFWWKPTTIATKIEAATG